MIYFDQAASSFPKPPEVTEAMIKAMNEIGANPGRGGHAMAREAAAIIQQTREKAAELFGCSDPKKVLFYQNATVALNQALKGMTWEKGDHIITTSAEHNSVRRPLEYLKQTHGVVVSYIPWIEDEPLLIENVKQTIRPETKLMAVTHASNVTGIVLPLHALMVLAKKHEIITLVDGSQTAGHRPIHMQNEGIDMLAFPGHKGLLGPQGTGLLLVEGEVDLTPLHHGGTGHYSEAITQPEQWPEKLESGTLNTPGIAGLYAALKVFERHQLEIVPRETMLIQKLIAGVRNIPGLTCYISSEAEISMPILAFNILHVDSQEIAMVLDSHYNIAVRAGLHCSPLTHGSLKTTDQGVVRVSLNRYNTEEEVEVFIQAIEEIATVYQEI